MKKIAIIGQNLFPAPKEIPGYEIECMPGILKKVSTLTSILRAVIFRTTNHFRSYFYEINSIVTLCKSSDVVILHDCMPVGYLNSLMVSIQEQTAKDTRLILYFWNKVKGYDSLYISDRWEYITYDYNESKKYGFKYVGGFYTDISIDRVVKSDESIYFVGVDDGRFCDLRRLEAKLNAIGLLPHFEYVSPMYAILNKSYSSRIPYKSVVQTTKSAQAILEWMKPGQSGLTLRTYEAIFYDKKLITNNKDIKRFKFYNSDNIFICDNANEANEIKSFLEKPFNSSVYKKYKKYYSYEQWLIRLIENYETSDSL